jgi:hypothetical protein
MTTLIIDRQTLPEPLLSLIGGAPRIVVSQRQDGGEIILTPTTKTNSDDIDPADYDNDTDYINAIPGMAERLIESMNAPASEFKPAPRHLFHV